VVEVAVAVAVAVEVVVEGDAHATRRARRAPRWASPRSSDGEPQRRPSP
jgi:hypothetical protein